METRREERREERMGRCGTGEKVRRVEICESGREWTGLKGKEEKGKKKTVEERGKGREGGRGGEERIGHGTVQHGTEFAGREKQRRGEMRETWDGIRFKEVIG